MSNKCNIGLYGLAVMGSNLARNIESRGYSVAVCNRTTSVTEQFIQDFSNLNFTGCLTLEDFVNSIERPRRIIIMVKAGFPTDATIDSLLPLLEKDDILIDGGNAWFKDTQRRVKKCEEHGVHFIGGEKSAWGKVADIFEKISAVVDGQACTNYIGPDGAGHFVKMVHNGIEYADMQLIAEIYHYLKDIKQLDSNQISEIFYKWNEGKLSSYLIEITAKIFQYKNENDTKHLVELILDKAGQKGTGQWTAEVALELGIPVPTINAAVNARSLSSFKSERVYAAKELSANNLSSNLTDISITELQDALYAAKIIAYAQGMDLIAAASKEYDWNLNLGEIAALWKGGCIIRAKFLDDIKQAYEDQPELANLMLARFMSKALSSSLSGLRKMTADASLRGVPMLACSSALAYYDSYRLADLPQNLTQAQRDFFGAHTYQRKDREGVFHTEWESA